MKKLLAFLMAAFLAFAGMSAAFAAPLRSVNADDDEPAAAATTNLDHWNYWADPKWSQPVRSHLYENADGTFTRVEYNGAAILVEVYDADFEIVSSQTVAVDEDTPLYGGFICGSEYNFFVFGQNNLEDDDSVEVYRIVKYTKDWQRVSQVGVFGANTYKPFRAGTMNAVEYGGYLLIHTCHEMYASSDGLHHQSNFTLIVDIAGMDAADNSGAVRTSNAGYCSHSFNQLIALDGDSYITLDHGDAYPRYAVLRHYPLSFTDGVLDLPAADGSIGTITYPLVPNYSNNYTFTTIGGLQATSYGYMTAGVSAQSTSFSDPRNVYLTVTQKGNFTSEGHRIIWLTDYVQGGTAVVGNPHLIKINDDKLLVMWREGNSVKMAFVDGEGSLISDIVGTMRMSLSDCRPILVGGKIVWYVTNNSAPVFYSVDVSGEEPVPELAEDPAQNALNEALNAEGGTLTFASCGAACFTAQEVDGRYAAVSGMGTEEYCEFSTDVALGLGDRLVFDYMTTGSGLVTLVINGSNSYISNGEPGWHRWVYTAEKPGLYALTVKYKSDSNVCVMDDFRVVPADGEMPEEIYDALDEALNAEGGDLEFTTVFNGTFITAEDGDRFVAVSSSEQGISSYSIGSSAQLNEGDSIVFEYKLLPASDCGYLTFNGGYGTTQLEPHSNGWQVYVLTVTNTGNYNFTWRYVSNGNSNYECMIDNVRIVPAGEELPVQEPDPNAEELNAALNAEGGEYEFYTIGTCPFTVNEEPGRLFAESSLGQGDSATVSCRITLNAGDALVVDYKCSSTTLQVNANGSYKASLGNTNGKWGVGSFVSNQTGTFKIDFAVKNYNAEAYCAIDNVRIIPNAAARLNEAMNVEGGEYSFSNYTNYSPFVAEEENGRLIAKTVSETRSMLSVTVSLEEGDRVFFEYRATGLTSSEWFYFGAGYLSGIMLNPANCSNWQLYSYTASQTGNFTLMWSFYNEGGSGCLMLDNFRVVRAGEPDPDPVPVPPAVSFERTELREREEDDSLIGVRFLFRVDMNGSKVCFDQGNTQNFVYYNGEADDELYEITGIDLILTRTDTENPITVSVACRNIYAMHDAEPGVNEEGAWFEFSAVLSGLAGRRADWLFTADAYVTYAPGASAHASSGAPVSLNSVLND